jgi:hypothetical protein
MKSYVVVACIKTALWSATLTFAITMPLSLLLHHATNCHGLNDASTSLKVGGGRARSRNNYSNQSKLAMSGSTK